MPCTAMLGSAALFAFALSAGAQSAAPTITAADARSLAVGAPALRDPEARGCP